MVLSEEDFYIMKVGSINCNPLNGLCYRTAIEVKRIYDGCRKEYNNLTLNLQLSGFSGANRPPFTFISVESNGVATISNLVIDTVNNDNDRYTVDYDYTLPLLVRFTDADGLNGTATSSITMHNTVSLRLPNQTLTPYTIEVWAMLSGRIGSFNGTNSVTVQACIIVITKVTMIVDLVIPTYGYCNYPECSSDSLICPGFSNLNRFPPLT